MRSAILFLLVLLLPLTVAADEMQLFAGLNLGSNKGTVKYSDSDKNTDSELVYGARFGINEENARVYLAYNTVQDGAKWQSLHIAVEGVSNKIRFISNSYFKFFLGAHAGGFAPDEGSSDFMGGAQGGIIFLLPADFEMELAYRHFWTQYDNRDFDAGDLYLAVNYKF